MTDENFNGCIKDFLQKLSEKPEEGYIYFYRGHRNKNWELKPSVFRDLPFLNGISELTLIQESITQYPDYFRDCHSLFDILVVCQHYEIPTRMLDITTNPLVALWFASSEEEKKEKEEDGQMYILEIKKDNIYYHNDLALVNYVNDSLKEICYDSNAISDFLRRQSNEYSCNGILFENNLLINKDIVCVKAKLDNPRIKAQSGAFLFFSKDEELKASSAIQIRTISIPKSFKKQIRETLCSLGITTRTLFPELPQFAVDLKTNKINF